MGWVDDEGVHEMYVLDVFADGARGGSISAAGIRVTEDGDGNKIPYGEQPVRSRDEVTGWVVCCNCGGGWNPPRVDLARWTRVYSAAEEDPGAGQFHAPDPDPFHGPTDREDVNAVLEQLWDAHVIPGDATRAVKEAARAQREAARQLDDAVAAGRAASLSWADIGRAVGITRQSARERWGTPPCT